jgi:hypothetical protein
MKRLSENQEERGLLREIHAYWASNTVTTEELYKHLCAYFIKECS